MKKEVENLKRAIVEFLAKGGPATFDEVSRGVPGFAGDLPVRTEGENLYLWHRVSQAATDALNQLHVEGKLEYKPTDALVYETGSERPALPIARRAQAQYKTPHWLLPVMLKLPG